MSAVIAWQRPSLITLLASIFGVLALTFLSMPAWPSVKEPISVGIVADNKPYTSMAGRTASGFSIDIVREVASQSGLDIEFRAGSWPEVFGAFQRGDIDVIEGISYNDGRARTIQFTEPYHIRQMHLMHDPANPLKDIDSPGSLSDYRIGVVRDAYFRDALETAGLSLVTYDSIPGLVRALAFGWVDGIIGPELTLNYYANEAGFRFLEIAGPAPLGEWSKEDFRLGVLKSNDELFDVVSSGLAAIPDERIEELFKRWQEYGGTSIAESSGFTLSDAHQHYISEVGPVRVGFMSDYAPFSFHDADALQGLSVDVLNRISDLTGLQIVPVPGQWSELYPRFMDRDIDIMANISKTDEREAFIRFTRPYHIIPNVAFTLDKNLAFKSPADLQGLKVAIGSGI
ncbi:transporter substrate-binding domain-containing protein [Marinobacter salarius]|uniref:transporter substrate-binding domain-containing protein n=4 Tax=Marinobacter TaxID=2742 RepID=UPI002942909B|nr:transporter substrate-binding domain-containing protein [Marinobacter salarius]WOI20302.1 transporter substrate-binding domain-containing protein [Marinobacter salarius]